MLAEVALALGRLDHEPGAVHVVADGAQQRLDPAGAEQRVVDVVLVRRSQVAVAGVPRLLVGVVEDDELQLGAGQRDQPRRRRPARPAPAGSAAGDCDDRRVPSSSQPQVAVHHRRARQPRHRAQRVQVEARTRCRRSRAPRSDRVAVDGVHVDVDGEQVVAALGAVLQHGVQEELGVDPLALQPALHVGERDDDGVDVTVARSGVRSCSTVSAGWAGGIAFLLRPRGVIRTLASRAASCVPCDYWV